MSKRREGEWFADAVPVRRAMIDAYFTQLSDVERVLCFRLIGETLARGRAAAPFPVRALAKHWRGINRTVSRGEIEGSLTRLVDRGVLLRVAAPPGGPAPLEPHYCINEDWPYRL